MNDDIQPPSELTIPHFSNMPWSISLITFCFTGKTRSVCLSCLSRFSHVFLFSGLITPPVSPLPSRLRRRESHSYTIPHHVPFTLSLPQTGCTLVDLPEDAVAGEGGKNSKAQRHQHPVLSIPRTAAVVTRGSHSHHPLPSPCRTLMCVPHWTMILHLTLAYVRLNC